MASYTIRTVNSEMDLTTLVDADDAAAAGTIGVRGAASFLQDEIGRGRATAAMLLTIEDEAGNVVRRVAASMSVADLILAPLDASQPEAKSCP